MNNYKMEELIPIVAELSELYTSKQSSSISYDRAKQLMGAVLYCIDENKQQCISENNSVSVSVNTELTAKDAYVQGYLLVVRKVEKIVELFNQISCDFKDYGNRNYYDTFIKGIPGFIQYYDARFNPQNHILTLDYPTLKNIDNICGADAIYQYISYIGLEQLFLNQFPEEYIRKILIAYHEDYEELFINISGIVMRNVIGKLIFEKINTDKKYTVMDYSRMTDNIQRCTRQELIETLMNLLQNFIIQKYNNQDLFEYLAADIVDFSFELQNAADNNFLNRLFLL